MVYDVVGTGVYAIPSNIGSAQNTTTGFRILLLADPGIVGFAADDIRAWVIDSQTAAGGEGERSLACCISGFSYNNKVCLSEAEVDVLTAAIEAALLSASEAGTITSVGVQEVNLFDGGVSSH